jgi:hypothetical protein
MPSRTSNWMIATGALVAFLGLCAMPAALSDHTDTNLLGVGASVFAFGALFMAAGVYVKARLLQSKADNLPASAAANPQRRSRGACDLCREESPVIHCKVHQFHLCGACLAEHYDFRACVYVPSTRRAENKSGKAMAARAHA